jgi:NADPH-dependent ferric siderophore reductase
VSRTRRLSPSLLRVTLGGEALEHLPTGRLDQRVKLLFPLAGGGYGIPGLLDEPPIAMSDWYAQWRAAPTAERCAIRTYTLRNPRPDLRELDIEFVLHGDAGPASAWALRAAPGDELVVVGPDARAAGRGGIEWDPGAARTVLLAGDETAVPAVCAILESLPADVGGHAFLEVPHDADALQIATASSVGQSWLGRGDAPIGRRLEAAVRGWAAAHLSPGDGPAAPLEEIDLDQGFLWEVPDTEQAAGAPGAGFYAWLAGEAGAITALRRHLVRDVGIDRSRVAFMGYWRRGRAEN